MDAESTSRVKIERSVLQLCPNCAKFGTPVDPPPTPSAASSVPSRIRVGPIRPSASRRFEERDVYLEMPEMELAPDWFQRIRVAREHRAWTPEVFGKKLNEKKSVVLKIESGSFRPPDSLIRKIEHQLRIRLRADPEANPTA
ncbi:MAG: multiprotein-bridging factor 1 family protein [Thermoplasmata archaeon]